MSPARSTGPGTGPQPEPVPQRVRVTSPRRDARRMGERRPRAAEFTEQTGLGEVYLQALLRAQMRVAGATLLVLGLVLGALPAVFYAVPSLAQVRIGPAPLPWLVIGVALYPALAIGARLYVRICDRVERDFVEFVDGQ